MDKEQFQDMYKLLGIINNNLEYLLAITKMKAKLTSEQRRMLEYRYEPELSPRRTHQRRTPTDLSWLRK